MLLQICVPDRSRLLDAAGQQPCAREECELRQVRKEATVSISTRCRSKLLPGCIEGMHV